MAVGTRYEHVGDLVDPDWTPPAEETHTNNPRVTRDFSFEDRVTAFVNGTLL